VRHAEYTEQARENSSIAVWLMLRCPAAAVTCSFTRTKLKEQLSRDTSRRSAMEQTRMPEFANQNVGPSSSLRQVAEANSRAGTQHWALAAAKGFFKGGLKH